MASFHCILTGCPPPEVRWYHNGTLVEAGSKRIIDSSSIPVARITVCTLSIADVSATDLGNYQCFGNNTIGSTQSQIVQLKSHDGMFVVCVNKCILWHKSVGWPQVREFTYLLI